MSDQRSLARHPIHLGLGAAAESQPQFTGAMEWYADYAARTASDGIEGRLVAMHTFDEPWDSWERHPNGAEVVLCTGGSLTIVQEVDGGERRVDLNAGEYVVNAPGVWHTADVAPGVTASAVFITAGVGTEHRAR